MKLWIRSQDREMLLQVEKLRYYQFEEHQICAEGVNYPLGTYASKERCIEVLDEIQELLIPKFISCDFLQKEDFDLIRKQILKKGNIVGLSKETQIQNIDMVYQMPLE